MKVTIEGSELVIRIPANLKNPPASASGKSRIVVTSGGNQPAGVSVLGSPLVVGVNACIKGS